MEATSSRAGGCRSARSSTREAVAARSGPVRGRIRSPAASAASRVRHSDLRSPQTGMRTARTGGHEAPRPPPPPGTTSTRRAQHDPVVRRHFVQQRRQRPARRDRGAQAEDDPDRRRPHALPEHHRDQAERAAAEGEANREFGPPTRRPRRHHPVDPESHQQHARHARRRRSARTANRRRATARAQDGVHRPEACRHRHQRVDPPHRPRSSTQPSPSERSRCRTTNTPSGRGRSQYGTYATGPASCSMETIRRVDGHTDHFPRRAVHATHQPPDRVLPGPQGPGRVRADHDGMPPPIPPR